MGQYRQWLHYREVDQQLHARLAQVEQQVTQLNEEMRHLAKEALGGKDNVIMRALLLLHNKAPQPQESLASPALPAGEVAPPTNGASRSHTTNGEISAEVADEISPLPADAPSWVSPALFAQARLPNFDMFTITKEDSQPSDAIPSSVPLSPHPDSNLLPQDMATFFADITSHSTLLASQIEQPPADEVLLPKNGTPVDQQSMRTDHLIQRWFERWGRASQVPHPQYEDQEV